jgi:hypothetical protein
MQLKVSLSDIYLNSRYKNFCLNNEKFQGLLLQSWKLVNIRQKGQTSNFLF